MLLLGRGDGVSAVAFLRFIARRGLPVLLMLVGIVGSVIWPLGSRTPIRRLGMWATSPRARSLARVALTASRRGLKALYIQHEAIGAQKLMVNSPNHTTVSISVGLMGVPLTVSTPRAAAAR